MLTVGEILHKARLYKGISLTEIAQETKINKKYLKWIENNELERFDSPAHLYGFIKNFATHIGVDEKKITAIYKRQVDRKLQFKRKAKPRFTLPAIIVTYRSIALIITGLFIIGVFGYLVMQFYKLQQPPRLELVEPKTTIFTTSEPSITLQGATENNVYLTINGVQVIYDDAGTFSVPFALKEGANTIQVKAQSQSNQNKTTTISMTVTYDKAQIATPTPSGSVTPPPANSSMKVEVEVKDDVAWVQIVADDVQKAVGVLDPGFKKTYTVNNTFFVISGRPAITSVKVNGEKKAWVNRDKSWIVECTLKDGAISCK